MMEEETFDLDPATDSGPHRILIVDDTPQNLTLLEAILGEAGYELIPAVNGKEAISLAESESPDLILLDIRMPEMDGFEACERLKASPTTADIPVIFLTAYAGDEEHVIRGFELGTADYVTKPFHHRELLARVRTHLELGELRKDLEKKAAEGKAELERTHFELQFAYDQQQQLVEGLNRFVPSEFLELLGHHSVIAVDLGEHIEMDIAVLFSDIRGFTPLSERLGTPSRVFSFINHYLTHVGPAIHENNGYVDKYYGDGVMAVFTGGALDGIRAGIAMQEAVKAFNVSIRAEFGFDPIRIGIGVHLGSAMLGTIGYEQRMDGTVISDAVNVSSRLEELTKHYGANIIVSEPMLHDLPNRKAFTTRVLGKAQVKGKSEPIRIYEVLDGSSPESIQRKATSLSKFEEGLEHFYARKFPEASVQFNQVLANDPDDKAARMYFQRSAQYMVQPPPIEWDGVEVFTVK